MTWVPYKLLLSNPVTCAPLYHEMNKNVCFRYSSSSVTNKVVEKPLTHKIGRRFNSALASNFHLQCEEVYDFHRSIPMLIYSGCVPEFLSAARIQHSVCSACYPEKTISVPLELHCR